MSTTRFTGPRVLRLVAFTDFIVALVCLATPLLRAPLGATATYAFAGFLLAGSAMSFLLARFIERQIEERLGLRDVPVRGEVRCG